MSFLFSSGVLVPIPQSAIAQYDFREEDGTVPVADQTGNGNNLTNGAYSGVGRSINGNQAGDFDGTDDRVYETAGETFPEPNTIIAVIQADLTGDDDYFVDSTSTGRHLLGQQADSNWFINQGSTITGSAADTNPHIITGVFDSTDELRVDGSTVATGDAGSADLTGFNIGSLGGGGNHWDGAIGFVELHDGAPSNGLATREEQIADSWGITI